MKVSKYDFYEIKDLDNPKDQNDYFFTSNHISKFIYNNKRYKTPSKLQTILNNENYEIELIKSLVCYRKDAFTELALIKNSIPNETIIQDTLIKKNDLVDDIILHNETKNKSLIYGLANEISVYNFLKFGLELPLEKSVYPYSKFDFYNETNYFIYELKTLTYSVDKYKTAVMNTDKLIYNRIIFLFEYTNNETTERKALYYYVYDPKFKYNKRIIKPLNRLNYTEIIDIPVWRLKRLRYIEDFKLVNEIQNANETEIKLFDEIINADKIQGSFLSNKFNN